jgi:hypothetical protein
LPSLLQTSTLPPVGNVSIPATISPSLL